MEECLVTRDETVSLLMMIQAAYPNYKPPDKRVTVNTWHLMLNEVDYNVAEAALKAYIMSDTSGFAPAIGQLMEKVRLITQPQELNEMEAWSLVRKAIRSSGYNSVSEFAKLPSIVQRAVGQPSQLKEWALDENFNANVVGSNFMRTYRAELDRAKMISKLPENIQQRIEQNRNKYTAEIEEKNRLEIENGQLAMLALETVTEGVPMPEKYREQLENMKNER